MMGTPNWSILLWSIFQLKGDDVSETKDCITIRGMEMDASEIPITCNTCKHSCVCGLLEKINKEDIPEFVRNGEVVLMAKHCPDYDQWKNPEEWVKSLCRRGFELVSKTGEELLSVESEDDILVPVFFRVGEDLKATSGYGYKGDSVRVLEVRFKDGNTMDAPANERGLFYIMKP